MNTSDKSDRRFEDTAMSAIVSCGYANGHYSTYADRAIPDLEKAVIDIFLSKLPAYGSVLDVGCGYGTPYDDYIYSKGFNITGVDNQKKHIVAARERVPHGTFVVSDFMKYNPSQRFDGVVSFYAIFNIPRESHRQLLARIYSQLNEGGHILITLGAEDNPQKITDFIGSKMAWSSYSAQVNRDLVRSEGFEILMDIDDMTQNNHHQWIMGVKR